MSIILFTSHIIIGFISKVPSQYHCPACKSEKIIEYEEYIECLSCHLEFFKEGLDEIEDENQLSTQELEGIVEAFDELGTENSRRLFSRSLRKGDSEDDEKKLDYYDT